MNQPNRLIKETSPYLLQHAYNPVDWFPWGDEALERAKNENKPILVSIGYSACHWCHVMERESFEHADTAALMNAHFINIKIDREERPDLDHIYMDAVQTMTGSGGWPLNVFLTPDARPFYGGTYFPPQRAHNRPSWTEVLHSISSAYRERENEIVAQAENLTAHLLQSNQFGQNSPATAENPFSDDNCHTIFENLMQTADKADGGFGRAPKFPQTLSIQYLLAYHHFFKKEAARDQAFLSLNKMVAGGIYDQIGGGFARYATDTDWLVPHFEKMLYDNALLLSVLSEAYQISQDANYLRVIQQTMEFIEREMLSPEAGFYAAIDADSEGEEGRFYVWSKMEIEQILEADAALFCAYFDVTEKGNWEGTNILNTRKTAANFAAENGLDLAVLEATMEAAGRKLLAVRNKRIRPLLDDKVLLGWNALMNMACSKAFAATGKEAYRELAISNMRFLLEKFWVKGKLWHTYKEGTAKHTAFLDDAAFLVQALIHLQEISGEKDYLLKAKEITEYIISGFSATETPLFYYTHVHQKDVIIRKREIYDSAIPSGNSIMAGNLAYLCRVFENRDWEEQVLKMLESLSAVITRYPVSFGAWAMQVLLQNRGYRELVVTGVNFNKIHFQVLRNFKPGIVLQLSATPHKDFPLLAGKLFKDPPLIYLCKNYACNPPVESVEDLSQALEI